MAISMNNFVDKEWKLFLEYKHKNTCFNQYYKDIYSIFEHNDIDLNKEDIIDDKSNKEDNIIIEKELPKTKEKQSKKLNNNKKKQKVLDKEDKKDEDKDENKEDKDENKEDEEDEDDDEEIEENENNKLDIMELYISTQTKIAFLNKTIDIYDVFWKIPLISYDKNTPGVLKKQVIYNLSSEEQQEELIKKYNVYKENGFNVDDYITKNIINPNGRIKFKSVRKISIGLSKKDLNGKKYKKKSAFYNCFVIILRYNDNEGINNVPKYNEYHVKIFNTGKIEIPGIQKTSTFNKILDIIISILEPIIISTTTEKLNYFEDTEEMVIINSNFYCGFEINREKLYEILKEKYNLQVIYDSCSYPGIKCRFYYNLNLPSNEQNGIYYSTSTSTKSLEIKKNFLKISFMIFRTGKILIVGKCHEGILNTCFVYLCNLLKTEYENICIKNLQIL